MSDRRFDAILIDFYGTLAADDRACVERICDLIVSRYTLDLSPRELGHRWGGEFFQTIDRCNGSAFRSLVDCERQSLSATLRPLVGDVPIDDFILQIETYWRRPPLHPDAKPFLDSLCIPICCVSNADRAHLDEAIALHGLHFDAVVTSECARCYKPGGRIFELASTALGVKPSRLIHIGDSLHSDIDGAMRAGISAGWICRDDRIYDTGDATPDFQFSTLNEVLAVL